jgi:hypothetical protein
MIAGLLCQIDSGKKSSCAAAYDYGVVVIQFGFLLGLLEV